MSHLKGNKNEGTFVIIIQLGATNTRMLELRKLNSE